MSRQMACTAGDGAVNEDVAELGSTWALVLDGATAPPVETGCRHSVRWYVERLSSELTPRLRTEESASLPDLLAESIAAVTAAHASTCDTSNPASPSSTVALLRERSDQVEYLVLADSPVILDVDGQIQPVLDTRIDSLPAYDLDTVNRVRNTDDGFWVASTDPDAAQRAITGSFPRDRVQRAVLASDGATRLVDVFGLLDWAGLVEVCTRTSGDGPSELIDRTRTVEDDPNAPMLPGVRRGKGHDDASVVALDYREEQT